MGVRVIAPEKKVYTVPEAAQVLGISRARMYEVVRMEGFPVLRIGSRILVPIKALDMWIDAQCGITVEIDKEES